MRIENLHIRSNGNFTRAVARITWEDCAFDAQEIYFEVPSQFGHLIADNPDAFFVACSLPAMYYGEKRIHMEDAICPELKAGITLAMAWIHYWFQVGNLDLQLDCPVRDRIDATTQPKQAASFFTGGIDSWANLIKNHQQYPTSHPRYIKDFFVVHGLQRVRIHNFEKAVAQFQQLESILGVNFIPVYTNIYAYLIDHDAGHQFWKNAYNGAALAAVGHALFRQYDVFSIASGNDIANLVPLGSHPNLDPNYSSCNLRITHDGVMLSRLGKTKLIAQSEIALQNLRVCDMPELPPGKQNCGICEKCVRTTLTLEALNLLQKTQAFPYQQVSRQIAQNACINHKVLEKTYFELLPLLEADGKHEISRILKSKIHRFHLKQLDQQRCGGVVFGTAKRMKSMMFKPLNKAEPSNSKPETRVAADFSSTLIKDAEEDLSKNTIL